jgi:glycosyltransferase involved in cell wall biosynthesis
MIKSIKMKQKKIGVLIRSQLPPNVETDIFNYGQMLYNDFQLDLVVNCDVPEKFERYFSIQTFVRPSKSRYLNYMKDFINWYKYAKKEKPDLLLTQDRINLVIATIVGKVTQSHVIIKKVGGPSQPSKPIKENINKIKKNILGFFTRLSYLLATGIIVQGPIQKDQLLRKGFKNKRIEMIPQPIDQTQFFPPTNSEKEQLKKELDLEKSKKVILFVGRLTKLKGAEILLQIIPKVLSKRNDIIFCLVGEGPYHDRFQSLDQNNVRVVDKVNHEKIDPYYKAADLLILPSLSEGLPNVILEALACGVPVAASGVGEIPSVVSTVFSSENEYVDFILNDKWKKDKLPEEFSWDMIKEKYTNFFNEIIKEQK